MAEVDVQADGEHRYAAVLTTSAGTRSEHVVTSDPALLERLDATRAEEPVLVRRVLEVLAADAERAEAQHAPTPVPDVVDLAALDRERPGLLAGLPLR